ncbi:uncharacterized protein LOC110043811 isoform X2 [Orbicella faveolata]|uniref:uncharacterized protein LOC110043811 isoform X2 n=1 Tax=Orbicella faveolata TaxID=48498 RepID=UPI0009E1E89C|nr:uncharacterized protein LOC110043811 isoform X2 [Orbicella faveolata]
MAAATPSPLAASTETTNGIKLRRLLVDGGTTVLRKVFDGIHPPTKLTANLHLNNSTLDDLFARGILSEQQRNRLFPPDGSKPDSKTFDITLLFLLLTEICGLSPPARTGWNHKPQAKNKSLAANLVRIKLFRNKLIHTPETRIDSRLFNELWKEISGVLVSLGLDQAQVDRLKTERCGEEDYLDVLFKWADREKEIKSMVELLRQGQAKMQKAQQDNQVLLQDTKTAVEAACKTQQEHLTLLQDANAKLEQARETQQVTKLKLETIHQSQAKTQETAERVHHTQLQDHETLQANKSKLGKVHQTQTKTQETVKKVRQTQLEYRETLQDDTSKLDKVHQTQIKTKETVERVRQSQLEDRETLQNSKSKLDEVHQTQTKTRETVERVRQSQLEDRETLQDSRSKLDEVHQTQIKTQQVVKGVAKTQEEHFESLQVVKQAVNSLKQEREADKEKYQVLKNLAKAEFKGDIEYHVGRYQEGTREWVFNEVENWLDNKRSQNRVMVISANAGMGKSVISAVICKRMQEDGRLAGSHFCQHNNARYRNPQLMLQSLSCHLCNALPEYKQALVKQLSRNLGKDLNDMGVEELFSLLFKEPLSTVADRGRNMLMVIDGLDESEYQERNELLDVIANHLCKLPCWIRFLCTTRPERNIAEALTHLKPFLLESNDDKNIEDIKWFFEKRMQQLIEAEKKHSIVEKLVEKSDGLMLYAYFLVSFIEEDVSVLDQEDLEGSLPLAISSIYHSYFKRLENELKKEVDVKVENFLNLLAAVTVSREPLPTGFLSKLLVPNARSPLARRKELKAISSVSSLLPIREGCLHVIHKSVKDWLTDASFYGEHEFSMDEKEGHQILASLCARELVELKQKDVLHRQFTPTEKYALHHGVKHMLLIDEEMKSHSLRECVKTYVLDLELLYAKLCLNDSVAAGDILWLHKQKMFPMLSEDSQDMLHILLFLLRKYFSTFSDHPHVFFQTVVNEGGSFLSPMASDLLLSKYPELPYMELVQKQMQQGVVLARFRCSSPVACFDVSPELDYMVCECDDGTIYMWSLHTGKLVWTRPVIVKKLHFGNGAYRMSPSSPGVLSFYRSVVFHPTKEVVLPGVLSRAYDFKGEMKPLFPESSCNFTVCSISGDKTTMLTDCPDNPKCIIMWSLRNGSEIIRTTRKDDVLSFAWSRDGKMVAISHCMGSICLVDVTYGFRTLAQTALPESCGMIKFSPNCQSLFCFSGTHLLNHLVCLNINMAEHLSCSLDVCIKSYVPWKLESRSEAGFLLGDPLSSVDVEFEFVLNKKIVLRSSPGNISIDMLNIDETKKNLKAELNRSKEIIFALSGDTIYNVFRDEVRAFDVSSGELIGQVAASGEYLSALAMEEGVLILTITYTTYTIELWNVELSRCVRNWPNLNGIRQLIGISEQRVACEGENQVLILDTASGDIVSTIPIGRQFLACNSKCQLLTAGRFSLELWDGETLLWDNDVPVYYFLQAIFSLGERFVVVSTKHGKTREVVIVLDAVSGREVNVLDVKVRNLNLCKFISGEECVISSEAASEGLLLFNVQSGKLLSVIDLESPVTCLATCPRKQLVAINKSDSKHGFKLIQTQMPRSLGNIQNKREKRLRVFWI